VDASTEIGASLGSASPDYGDLLPAGPKLRRAGSIRWPISQFEMSLTGFEHVFAITVNLPLANGAHIRITLPVVTVLLKIIAYTDDPYHRAKDLDDTRVVFSRYEGESERLFSEAVFDAALPDFSEANAFLLGLDLRRLATREDTAYIERFVARMCVQDEEEFDPGDFAGKMFRAQIRAFERGLKGR
jgi:predicted nucleotidyltransferase